MVRVPTAIGHTHLTIDRNETTARAWAYTVHPKNGTFGQKYTVSNLEMLYEVGQCRNPPTQDFSTLTLTSMQPLIEHLDQAVGREGGGVVYIYLLSITLGVIKI